MPVSSWSTTASDNATADSASGISWPEGMSPAQVNDSARALMAVIKGDLANSLTGIGYQKLPNGLILQWGSSAVTVVTGGGAIVPFTTAFPTECFTVVPSNGDYSFQGGRVLDVLNKAANQFSVQLTPAGSVGGALRVNWIAVGR